MRRLRRLFAGPYRAPKCWATMPTVTPEESAMILKRQLARSSEMLEEHTRVDVRGATFAAERGTENFARRDGHIVEPLRHRRRFPRSRSLFLGRPTPVEQVD